MLRKIKVYGKLRQILGQSTFEADLNNVGQAFSFLYNNFPELQPHLHNQLYRVWTGKTMVTDQTLHMIGHEEIKIIPVATGSKFLAGAALLGASKFVGSTLIASALASIGMSMVIDGVTQLIAPKPSINPSGMEPTDPSSLASNYSFSGITNISRSGVPINLIYGETIVGSVTVSNGIDTVQVRGDA